MSEQVCAVVGCDHTSDEPDQPGYPPTDPASFDRRRWVMVPFQVCGVGPSITVAAELGDGRCQHVCTVDARTADEAVRIADQIVAEHNDTLRRSP